MSLTKEQRRGLEYAALISGVSVDDLNKGLLMIQRKIAYGHMNYKSTYAAILFISDKLHAAHDATERCKIAIDSFGKNGPILLPLLSHGSSRLVILSNDANKAITVESIKRFLKLLAYLAIAGGAFGLVTGCAEYNQNAPWKDKNTCMVWAGTFAVPMPCGDKKPATEIEGGG